MDGLSVEGARAPNPGEFDFPCYVLVNDLGEILYGAPFAQSEGPGEVWLLARFLGINPHDSQGMERGFAELVLIASGRRGQGHSRPGKLDQLFERQINTVKYLDKVFEKLYEMVPENTWIIVTADHGELFGENGYFGHGPINHTLVFEVPFLEGKIR